MVVGFNHNFRYKGEIYHIQTEDSGLKSPNIVTLLYQGGTILASKKTSYADIAKVDNLEQVVEELMKEQHKNMLRGLKEGEFDAVIARFKSGRPVKVVDVVDGAPLVTAPAVSPDPEPDVAPVPPPRIDSPPVAGEPAAEPKPTAEPKPAAAPTAPPRTQTPPKSPAVEISLDEVILSYLMGDDK